MEMELTLEPTRKIKKPYRKRNMEMELTLEPTRKIKKLEEPFRTAKLDDDRAMVKENDIIEESKINKSQNLWKIGTWNVRSLTGKEEELVEELEKVNADIVGITETKKKGKGEILLLVEELEKVNADIVGITETKKKGKGEILLSGGHLLIYCGVKIGSRAREGVGCFIKKENTKYIRKWTGVSERILKIEMEIEEKIKKENTKYIRKWTGVSERILKIEMEIEEKIKTTIVTVYGPSEDEKASTKDEFWDQLTETIEESEGVWTK
ncbi:hypothetical protein QE152_g10416 [Popillia japonica]|uniref:Endonuclease/exonuclease/phosphatase domain-containing protein n=1 Tax=Popillia japonica TaxID=7064 RepID=A0AAW1LRB8_POPJA